MTLDLLPEQPTDATDPGPAVNVIATLVTSNGVVVQMGERPDGALVLSPNGNRMPLVFDRFQRAALVAAMTEAAA